MKSSVRALNRFLKIDATLLFILRNIMQVGVRFFHPLDEKDNTFGVKSERL